MIAHAFDEDDGARTNRSESLRGLVATAPTSSQDPAAGAFSGTGDSGAVAEAAFSVACDATTTTAGEMLSGVVNLSIGFAPADWGEFVLLNIPLDAARTAS